MPRMNDAVPAFWSLFQACALDLAVVNSADSVVYDRLLARLQEIDPALYLEFCAEPGACELIVTAEGERSLFPLVRSIVAEAPAVDGWTIRALKPKIGFPATTRWEALTLNIGDIVFEPLERKGSDELGLRIFIPGIRATDTEDAHNAVLRAMDHGLGEERLADAVRFVEVRPLPADVNPSNLIPLSELDSYIEWRDRRRRGA